MTIPAGRTGIERGSDQFIAPLAYPLKIVNRFREGGPIRSEDTSLAGTVIGQEFTPVQLRRTLRLRVEALQRTDLDAWLVIFDGTGVATLKVDPASATTISILMTNDYEVEEYDGPYPENAPTAVTWSALEFSVLRLE
jgi:hypothetical protein